jgi:hypothetical protein
MFILVVTGVVFDLLYLDPINDVTNNVPQRESSEVPPTGPKYQESNKSPVYLLQILYYQMMMRYVTVVVCARPIPPRP